jgi:hypothetical protein
MSTGKKVVYLTPKGEDNEAIHRPVWVINISEFALPILTRIINGLAAADIAVFHRSSEAIY